MAASLIQAKAGSAGSNVASFPLTFSNPVNPGNCLIAVVGAAPAGRTFTVSDSVNGAWSGSLAGGNGGSGSLFVYSLASTATGTPTVTATVSVNSNIWMHIMEWNGLLGTVDQSILHNSAASTSNSAGPTATLTNSGETSICAIQENVGVTALTPGGSYTLVTTAQAAQAVSSFNVPDTSAQTGSWTWTTSSASVVLVATFNPGSANASVDTLLGQGWV